MNKGLLIGGSVAVLVLILIGGGMWYANQNMPVPQPAVVETDMNAVQPTTAATDSGSAAGIEPKLVEINMVGGGYKFDPAEVRVATGDTVRITFSSSGGTHDLVIDEYGIATSLLEEDEEEVVEFVADRPGTFEYYCSYEDHREMGMVGTLIVE